MDLLEEQKCTKKYLLIILLSYWHTKIETIKYIWLISQYSLLQTDNFHKFSQIKNHFSMHNLIYVGIFKAKYYFYIDTIREWYAQILKIEQVPFVIQWSQNSLIIWVCNAHQISLGCHGVHGRLSKRALAVSHYLLLWHFLCYTLHRNHQLIHNKHFVNLISLHKYTIWKYLALVNIIKIRRRVGTELTNNVYR